ncbi:CRISPR-associated endonuclease Cas6 [Methanococcus aeolicus]|uniref:CRISPR-associated endonuclease Cas6 n=1 Tax=Methanococcus aeolicus TaxID=42879 RepID=UPI0021C8D54F|nr:CRISPR-associated endonuclease Cas6 [Methanococcus aeolicus]UXM84648.1 CRISPR-associated endonuclease Cas6 [Methanococcus aeolicus]
MELKTMYCKLKTDKPLKKSQTSYLRGYILNKFNKCGHKELHHHSGNGFIYSYPKIQYKIMGGNAYLIGIDEGTNILGSMVLDIDKLELNHELYDVVDGYISVKSEDFGACDDLKKYRFVSPWVALNEKNYLDYKKLNENGRKEKLEKILIGNLLSMSKYLNYTVDKRIEANILEYDEIPVKYKGTKFIGFFGKFEVNFNIPNLLGIGGKVSKGFGSVSSL